MLLSQFQFSCVCMISSAHGIRVNTNSYIVSTKRDIKNLIIWTAKQPIHTYSFSGSFSVSFSLSSLRWSHLRRCDTVLLSPWKGRLKVEDSLPELNPKMDSTLPAVV